MKGTGEQGIFGVLEYCVHIFVLEVLMENVLDRGDSSGWIRGEIMERSMGCSCGLSALRLPHWNSPTPAHATSLGRHDWIVSKPSRLFSISSGVERNMFLEDPDGRVDARVLCRGEVELESVRVKVFVIDPRGPGKIASVGWTLHIFKWRLQ